MFLVNLVLYIVAGILFALAAFNVGSRVNLMALGLPAWVLVPLCNLVHSHA